MHSIYYSSVPRGTLVNFQNGTVIMVTANKPWRKKTVAGTIIYGKPEDVGMHSEQWCADVLYSMVDLPCDDSTIGE